MQSNRYVVLSVNFSFSSETFRDGPYLSWLTAQAVRNGLRKDGFTSVISTISAEDAEALKKATTFERSRVHAHS